MQKEPQTQNIITMTVKTATEQLFFTVVMMFFVSHSPRFGIKEKKKPIVKAPHIKKGVGFS